MTPLETLARLLRPAGRGIYTVSTGASEQLAVQKQLYRVAREEDIEPAWRAALARIAGAKIVILGIPSDVGAGFARGASFGPQALRSELIRSDSFIYRDARIVDAGDVFVVPQLLHDDMLSKSQLDDSRREIYGANGDALPVSPLSIAETALLAIRELAPDASLLVFGGDHSVGWPVVVATARGREKKLGILHFDAHTDLLETRLGVRYCFATWAYHANELIGRDKKLAQVGLRISKKTREHWENTLGVRQYWMSEIAARPAKEIAAEIIAEFRRAGVEGVYISNDIDGTDPSHAAATGTPEPGGLDPKTVLTLIEDVGHAFPVWASDLVEVAPPLNGRESIEPSTTLATAARYIEAQALAALSESS